MMFRHEVTTGAELPDLALTWREDRAVIPFLGWTLQLRIGRPGQLALVHIDGNAIIGADASPNVTIHWPVGELEVLAPGEYEAQLWAQRPSDNKWREPYTFTLAVKKAVT